MTSLEMLHSALASLAINGDPGAGLARRDKERAQIEGFLNSHIEERRGGVLYVCGPVGTGKTVLICNTISERLKAERRANIAVLNCVSQVDTAADLYLWVAERLCATKHAVTAAAAEPAAQGKNERALAALIEKNYRQGAQKRRQKMVVLLLDEMDDLSEVPRGKKALGRLFEWASDPESRIVLVGIGNDLVLRDKSFQSLTVDGNSDKGPAVMRFGAYKADDIEAILRERLGKTGVYSPPVLKFISMQTERMGGDLRTALTLCREPLLRAFIEFGRTKTSPKFPIGLGPVNAVVREMVDDTRANISSLPSQQKLFLGALLIAQGSSASGGSSGGGGGGVGEAGARAPAATRAEVHAAYQGICAKLGGSALSIFVLFRESLGPLVDLNFVRTSGDTVELLVEPEDVIKGVHSTPQLQKLLEASVPRPEK